MITPPLVQVGGSPFKPTRTLSGSELWLLATVLIIAVVTVVWAMWTLWRWRLQSRRRWDELTVLSRRAGLSQEEYAFLRRMLRRGKVSDPMSVMQNERAYVSFFENQPPWASHRTKLLVQSIQRKMFGTSPDTDRSA